MSRKCPSPLLLKLRQVKADQELSADIRWSLARRLRSLGRKKLTESQVDDALVSIEARRALLATVPTLRGAERVHSVVRLGEALRKSHGALARDQKRAVVTAAPTRMPVVTAASAAQDDEDHDGDEAGGER